MEADPMTDLATTVAPVASLTQGVALRQALGEALVSLGNADPKILVLDGDVGTSTGVALFEKAHPARFIQTGIAEQNMLAMAAGLATVGYQPWVTGFSCFVVARALDSIRVLVAQPQLDVKIVGGYAGLLTGRTGKTHQMLNDLAIMRSLSHVTVVAPADEHELRSAVSVLSDRPGPVYLQTTREPGPALFGPDHRFVPGKSVMLRDGGDCTLVSTGVQSTRVYEAGMVLAERGFDVRILHMPTVKPLDVSALVAAARHTGLLITVEEQNVIGGLGGAVAEALADAFPVTVKRLGVQDVYCESGANEPLLDKYRLSAVKVADDVERLLRVRATTLSL
jgi:transketolase